MCCCEAYLRARMISRPPRAFVRNSAGDPCSSSLSSELRDEQGATSLQEVYGRKAHGSVRESEVVQQDR